MARKRSDKPATQQPEALPVASAPSASESGVAASSSAAASRSVVASSVEGAQTPELAVSGDWPLYDLLQSRWQGAQSLSQRGVGPAGDVRRERWLAALPAAGAHAQLVRTPLADAVAQELASSPLLLGKLGVEARTLSLGELADLVQLVLEEEVEPVVDEAAEPGVTGSSRRRTSAGAAPRSRVVAGVRQAVQVLRAQQMRGALAQLGASAAGRAATSVTATPPAAAAPTLSSSRSGAQSTAAAALAELAFGGAFAGVDPMGAPVGSTARAAEGARQPSNAGGSSATGSGSGASELAGLGLAASRLGSGRGRLTAWLAAHALDAFGTSPLRPQSALHAHSAAGRLALSRWGLQSLQTSVAAAAAAGATAAQRNAAGALQDAIWLALTPDDAADPLSGAATHGAEAGAPTSIGPAASAGEATSGTSRQRPDARANRNSAAGLGHGAGAAADRTGGADTARAARTTAAAALGPAAVGRSPFAALLLPELAAAGALPRARAGAEQAGVDAPSSGPDGAGARAGAGAGAGAWVPSGAAAFGPLAAAFAAARAARWLDGTAPRSGSGLTSAALGQDFGPAARGVLRAGGSTRSGSAERGAPPGELTGLVAEDSATAEAVAEGATPQAGLAATSTGARTASAGVPAGPGYLGERLPAALAFALRQRPAAGQPPSALTGRYGSVSAAASPSGSGLSGAGQSTPSTGAPASSGWAASGAAGRLTSSLASAMGTGLAAPAGLGSLTGATASMLRLAQTSGLWRRWARDAAPTHGERAHADPTAAALNAEWLALGDDAAAADPASASNGTNAIRATANLDRAALAESAAGSAPSALRGPATGRRSDSVPFAQLAPPALRAALQALGAANDSGGSDLASELAATWLRQPVAPQPRVGAAAASGRAGWPALVATTLDSDALNSDALNSDALNSDTLNSDAINPTGANRKGAEGPGSIASRTKQAAEPGVVQLHGLAALAALGRAPSEWAELAAERQLANAGPADRGALVALGADEAGASDDGSARTAEANGGAGALGSSANTASNRRASSTATLLGFAPAGLRASRNLLSWTRRASAFGSQREGGLVRVGSLRSAALGSRRGASPSSATRGWLDGGAGALLSLGDDTSGGFFGEATPLPGQAGAAESLHAAVQARRGESLSRGHVGAVAARLRGGSAAPAAAAGAYTGMPADFSADRALLQPGNAAADAARAAGQAGGATAAGQASQAAGLARVLSVTAEPSGNVLPLVAPMAQAVVQAAAAKPLAESIVTSGGDATSGLPLTGGRSANGERGRGDTSRAGAQESAGQDLDALAQKIARSVMVRLKRERERRGLYG